MSPRHMRIVRAIQLRDVQLTPTTRRCRGEGIDELHVAMSLQC